MSGVDVGVEPAAAARPALAYCSGYADLIETTSERKASAEAVIAMVPMTA
jgi:hypothetical protein